MRIERRAVIFSVIIGLVLTLLTTLVPNNIVIGEFPNIRFVSIPMIGITYYGYPLPWIKQVVMPGAARQAIWSHLLINTIYWGGLVLLIKVLYPKPTEKVTGKIKSVVKMPAIRRPAKPPTKRASKRKKKPAKAKKRGRARRRSARR